MLGCPPIIHGCARPRTRSVASFSSCSFLCLWFLAHVTGVGECGGFRPLKPPSLSVEATAFQGFYLNACPCFLYLHNLYKTKTLAVLFFHFKLLTAN